MKKQGTRNNEQEIGKDRGGSIPSLKWISGSLIGPVVILIAAAIATVPLRLYNFSCGHDFDFHLVSWMDGLQSWKAGILDPHWTASPNYGAGEPRFIFYPPLTWMLGAALGTLFSWPYVPFAITFILLAATGFATRALARQKLSEGPATLAGCVALFSAYTLFTVYERSAYAELSGGFWIPLLLLLILLEGRREGSERVSLLHKACGGSAILLAIVLAGAWLSNAPVGVMASYLLAAVALTVSALSRSWMPVVRAAVGAALGLGLAAFYLVPAAWEQSWVAIRQATDDPGLLIENSFLFSHRHIPGLEEHNLELWKASAIAVAMIAVALIGLLICWRRRSLPGGRRWWIPLALIPVVVLLLQLPFSLFVWNLLPKLRFLQFPWRWLLVVEAPMAIVVAGAVWTDRRWWRMVVLAACGFVFVGSAGFAAIAFHQNCAPEDSALAMAGAFRAGRGSEGTDEYAPPTADNSIVATNLPAACLVSNPTIQLGAGDSDVTPEWLPEQGSCLATYAFDPASGRNEVQHRSVHLVAPQAGFLVLRLREYPAWLVSVNGKVVSTRPVRDDGLMAIPVPPGPVTVSADWTTTPDVRAGRWISLVALLSVIVLELLSRRRAHPKLK